MKGDLDINRLEGNASVLVLLHDLAKTARSAEDALPAICASITSNAFLSSNIVSEHHLRHGEANEAVHD